VQVLDAGVALEAVDVLKGVLVSGTGRRYPLNVPAAGKTGTQVNNTNAWFVGFTPQLTTAVWVGDPDAYTPMVGVPEFDQERVQGGLYPTQIWQHYMNNAHAFLPGNDWPAAPAPARAPQRLYLPGNECIYVVTGYDTQVAQQPAGFATQQAPSPPTSTVPPAPPPPPATVQVPVFSRVDSGTTIPPNVLDPRAPINTVPTDYRVSAC
jgi:membrane peptidoglycan carboxypeptidase